MNKLSITFAIVFALGISASYAQTSRKALGNPILFVTQTPLTSDFTNTVSTFGNHAASLQSAPRGGDLYIRYPNGTLRNLTREAGFGMVGFQGANAIAVRDPAVHWSGAKALFSMVIGAPTQIFQVQSYRWQLYEITGFGVGQTPVIVRVATQPAEYNNVQPTYASDDSIIFTSDRPRNGAPHLYPQHDEYESAPTVTGLWKLAAGTGALSLLQHSPSGSFDPLVDSFGRLVYTRWDHLQRDQQADAVGTTFGNFDWNSEAADSVVVPGLTEVFPESRQLSGNVNGHRFNAFIPWAINQDGTNEETVNHIGRQELASFFDRSFTDDGNLRAFTAQGSGRVNPNSILDMVQMSEDPTQAGRFIAIDSPEFGTNASGQLIRMAAPPTLNPDQIIIDYLTPRSTFFTQPAADYTGRYRNPIVASSGDVVVSHTPESGETGNNGTRANPLPKYHFRLKRLAAGAGGFLSPVENLTPGINATVSFFDPDVSVSYGGEMWELNPVEVRTQSAPPNSTFVLPSVEQGVFDSAGVNLAQFRAFLRARNLAVIVVRNATYRDKADRQQPFNLRVPGGAQTLGAGGTIYDIAHFQLFQADQVRGIGGVTTPNPGRRPLARALNNTLANSLNQASPGGPPTSVAIAADGSIAAYVPAQRALTWQSTAPNGAPVVRERYWLTVAAGEVRVCDGCHGVNTQNQASQAPDQHPPAALASLLQRWVQENGNLFANGFENPVP